MSVVISATFVCVYSSAPAGPQRPGKDVKEAWTETKQEVNKQKHRRKGTKKRRVSKSDMAGGNTWNVAGTSKWKYPTKVIVKGPMELQQLETFMRHKVSLIGYIVVKLKY